MLLKFGPFTIDSKGMPALQNVSVYPPLTAEAQGVRVQVFTRAAAPAEALKGGAQ